MKPHLNPPRSNLDASALSWLSDRKHPQSGDILGGFFPEPRRAALQAASSRRTDGTGGDAVGGVSTVHVLLLPIGVDGALFGLAVIRRELVRCNAGRVSLDALDLANR